MIPDPHLALEYVRAERDLALAHIHRTEGHGGPRQGCEACERVLKAAPVPAGMQGTFWVPDESGMGGEMMSAGQVYYDPDCRGWMVRVNQFQARIALPEELPCRCRWDTAATGAVAPDCPRHSTEG